MAEMTIIVPTYNEENAVGQTVADINAVFRDSGHTIEILVVDDGSADATGRLAAEAGATVIRHPCNLGYGNAIISGVRKARHPWIGLIDADGTYAAASLPGFLTEAADQGLDMIIGARQGKHYRGNLFKKMARALFKWLSEFTVGHSIPDINSGLRVIRKSMIERFAPILCGGFSFSTNLTIIAFLTNRFVRYRPIDYHERKGESKVMLFRDSLRAAQVLITTILLFNPLKIFLALIAVNLGGGAIALLLGILLPRLSLIFGLGVGMALGLSIIAGVGMIAEQRRATLMLQSSFHAKD